MSTIDVSGIDVTKPATGTDVSKADERTFRTAVRDQFLAATEDIEALEGAGGSGATTLDALSDVSADSPSADDVIAWSGTEWALARIESTSLTIVQAAHGLAVKDCVRYDAVTAQWVQADDNYLDGSQVVLGVVELVPDADTFRVVTGGLVTLSSLLAGHVYYLNGGSLSTAAGAIAFPVLLAISTTQGVLIPETSPVSAGRINSGAAPSGQALLANGAGGAAWGNPAAVGALARNGVGAIGASTWNPTLDDGVIYEITATEALDITLDSDVTGTDVYESEIWVDAQGYAVTFTNGDVTSSVDISGTAGDITKLFVRHYYDSDAGAPAFEVYQYNIKSAGVTLPATNLVAYWPLVSDVADAAGSYDLTLDGSAALNGSAPYGLDLTDADGDAAVRTADSVIDINASWTIYVAFKGDARRRAPTGASSGSRRPPGRAVRVAVHQRQQRRAAGSRRGMMTA